MFSFYFVYMGIFIVVCQHVCSCTTCISGTWRGQKESAVLGLELQTVWADAWILGIKLTWSQWAASALNCWPIAPDPEQKILTFKTYSHAEQYPPNILHLNCLIWPKLLKQWVYQKLLNRSNGIFKDYSIIAQKPHHKNVCVIFTFNYIQTN